MMMGGGKLLPCPRGVSRTGLRGGGGAKSCKCKVTGAIKAYKMDCNFVATEYPEGIADLKN